MSKYYKQRSQSETILLCEYCSYMHRLQRKLLLTNRKRYQVAPDQSLLETKLTLPRIYFLYHATQFLDMCILFHAHTTDSPKSIYRKQTTALIASLYCCPQHPAQIFHIIMRCDKKHMIHYYSIFVSTSSPIGYIFLHSQQ